MTSADAGHIHDHVDFARAAVALHIYFYLNTLGSP